MNIGICTGGGDCPGLNAAIREIVNQCIHTYGYRCYGILDSYNGLMTSPPKVISLGLSDVYDIQNKGGTILGSFNRGNLYARADGEEYVNRTIRGFQDLDLDVLVVIGGEGTHGMAKILVQKGLSIVGIPKTIDNDLPGTDRTIGFSSCVEFVSESVLRLRSTAESHERIMVVEVMGRDSGFIALHGGLAGGADVILIPEISFSYEDVIRKLRDQNRKGRKCSLVVVSEGARAEGTDVIYGGHNTGVKNLGGIGSVVATKLHEMTEFETRYSVLGHLQRGGAPTAHDKLLATAFANHAVELIRDKNFQKLVVEKDGCVTHLSYSDFEEGRRKIELFDPLLKAAELSGVCMGRPH